MYTIQGTLRTLTYCINCESDRVNWDKWTVQLTIFSLHKLDKLRTFIASSRDLYQMTWSFIAHLLINVENLSGCDHLLKRLRKNLKFVLPFSVLRKLIFETLPSSGQAIQIHISFAKFEILKSPIFKLFIGTLHA